MSENGESDDGLDELLASFGEGVPTAGSSEASAAGVAAADASTGLTRRQLRERRAAEEAAQAAPAEPVSAAPAEPDPTSPSESAPAAAPGPIDETSIPDWDPAPEFRPAAGLDAEPAPDWDPAPELGAPAAAVAASPQAAESEEAAESEDSAVPPGPAESPDSVAAPALPEPASVPAPDGPPTVPVRYDELAEAEPAQPPAEPPTTDGFPMRLDPPPSGPRRRRSLRWLAWFIPVLLVVAALGGGAWYAWTHYEGKVRQILGMSLPDDYSGTGNGQRVVVTIEQGASGSDIAVALQQAGVTMSWKAFNDLANRLAHSTDCAKPDPTNGCWPVIQFGNYQLQQQMSAQAALDALQDPKNKVTSNLVIPEGSTITQVLDIISATTSIPLDELKAAAADPGQFGAANPANSLEGYLYPDTYQLDGKETAKGILQRLVTQTFAKLDALGVKPADRHAFLTGASMVQKESGPKPGDAAKVARVFQNRLAQGMKLQSDATVAYGAGNTTSIWNSSAQLGDANNPYNTYVHPGLPIGPIAAPGAVAMDAWAHPADGAWLFFVPVNLKTGDTHFSTTAAEHEHYVQVLMQWCAASAENAAYCK